MGNCLGWGAELGRIGVGAAGIYTDGVIGGRSGGACVILDLEEVGLEGKVQWRTVTAAAWPTSLAVTD